MVKNIVGPSIRRHRNAKGWTQAMVATKCNLLGWDASVTIIGKIESQIRRVTDAELFALAKVLQVSLEDLYPKDVKKIYKQLPKGE